MCQKELDGGELVPSQFVDTTNLYYSHGNLNSINELSTKFFSHSESSQKSGGGAGTALLEQENPRAQRLYRQRLTELDQMKKRLGKAEKMLSENLENMGIQQKQYELQIDNLSKINKDK